MAVATKVYEFFLFNDGLVFISWLMMWVTMVEWVMMVELVGYDG